jgi:hypothetical protein
MYVFAIPSHWFCFRLVACSIVHMYSICTVFVRCMYNICTVYVQYMYSICTAYVQYMYSICLLLYSICTVYEQYMLNILVYAELRANLHPDWQPRYMYFILAMSRDAMRVLYM